MNTQIQEKQSVTEQEAFQILLQKLTHIFRGKNAPVSFAINGIEGTGKTTFAQKFFDFVLLENALLHPVHVSIDGYHFHKQRRYKQGRDSAKGYYEDAYDELSFVENVLLLSQRMPHQYIPTIHDLESDQYITMQPEPLPPNALIITDGAYVLKDVYNPHWDLRLYLKTDFATAQKRGVGRDKESLGGEEKTKEKYTNRYHAASGMYLEEVKPEDRADIMIDNSNFDSLILLKS